MPRPARRTGTTTTSAATRRPSAGPIGVSTVTDAVGTDRSASAASSTLMRVASRRNASGGVSLVAQRGQRVVHQRVIDEVDRHDTKLYTMDVRPKPDASQDAT